MLPMRTIRVFPSMTLVTGDRTEFPQDSRKMMTANAVCDLLTLEAGNSRHYHATTPLWARAFLPNLRGPEIRVYLPQLGATTLGLVLQWLDSFYSYPTDPEYVFGTEVERDPPFYVPPWSRPHLSVELDVLCRIRDAAKYLGLHILSDMAFKSIANWLNSSDIEDILETYSQYDSRTNDIYIICT